MKFIGILCLNLGTSGSPLYEQNPIDTKNWFEQSTCTCTYYTIFMACTSKILKIHKETAAYHG